MIDLSKFMFEVIAIYWTESDDNVLPYVTKEAVVDKIY